MAGSISFFLKGTGAVLMLHAAYSCMHYRSILQDLDLVTTSSSGSGSDGQHQDYETETSSSSAETMMIPPLDVYIEVVVAFLLILLGELYGIGSLQSVELVVSAEENEVKRKSLTAPAYRTRDFDIYNNRSKALLHRVTKND